MKIEPISIRKKVAAGESGKIEERIKGTGIIKQVNMRFYPGQEGTLKVRPYVRHHAGMIEDISAYPEDSEQGFYGDDDWIKLQCGIAVNNDDDFVVHYKNDNTVGATYDIVLDAIIEYY